MNGTAFGRPIRKTLHLSLSFQVALFTSISLNRCILTLKGGNPLDFGALRELPR